MNSPLRLVLSASALVAAALLAAGCASSPEAPVPSSTSTPGATVTEPDGEADFDAAWLDDGRLFAVVSWGSSTCVPVVDDVVAADGQKVSVSLVYPDPDAACTADLAPRASIGGLPEGVDPTQDVELVITLDGVTGDADLDGNAALTGVPGSPTEYLPSAGWFDDRSLVLLTWGSSSCPPVVESIDESDAAATVTFVTEDGACTMDMAPRATILGFENEHEDAGFELTLVGGGLDGTVSVIES